MFFCYTSLSVELFPGDLFKLGTDECLYGSIRPLSEFAYSGVIGGLFGGVGAVPGAAIGGWLGSFVVGFSGMKSGASVGEGVGHAIGDELCNDYDYEYRRRLLT